MANSFFELNGVRVPCFLYGTAWKEQETARLTELALQQGFRGIDTANQRRHYHEAGVGQGIAAAMSQGLVTRQDLFLQTKFTFAAGQDHRLPYDPQAPIPRQVEQSFQSSLEHLHTDYLDSYVLHGPSRRDGLGAEDLQAWQAMEALHDQGRTRLLGISNVNLPQLKLLCESARVPPRFVQNRVYAARLWDREIREYCSAQGIRYQGFSLLTANRGLAEHAALRQLAQRYGRTWQQLVFRFALDVGMLPLTGTTSAAHMREDLDVLGFELQPAEVRLIELAAAPASRRGS